METEPVSLTTMILAAAPGVLALIWTIFQQFAKASANTIDDKIVDVVNQVFAEKKAS